MEEEKKEKKRDWLEYEDGFARIKLLRPLGKAAIQEIKMREPTLKDQRAMIERKGSDIAKEASMFANMCELSFEEIENMYLGDYLRIQAAFQGFPGFTD